MEVFVGVTDSNWYRFLAARPYLTEVNFWIPSGTGFRRLSTGEPFAFKTRYPEHRIVGGGFFSGFVKVPVSDAWRIFGEANGVDSLSAMRLAISRNRRVALAPGEDPDIGCIMLRDTLFFARDETLPAPADWSKNLVRGRGYDAESGSGESIVEAIVAATVERHGESPLGVPGHVFGNRVDVAVRLGQRPFQALVLDAYHRRCSITGEKIRPVLQAAHIVPVAKGGANSLDNGILLRSDVHTMFDAGYIAVDAKYRLMVSNRLRQEFDNGAYFYERSCTTIAVPDRRADRPNREYLEWHADTVFLG